MKKIFLALLIVLTVSATAQTGKFERLPNDEFPLHSSLHSLETSDGNIVLMEECFNIVDGNHVDAGVNLLKINTDGELLSSKFVEFKAMQYDNPFIKNPFEENSNLMAGFIFNESEAKYYYTAVFFDDELNITETVETPIEAEGFDEYCDLFFDKNSNNIIMAYKSKSQENTYVYANMDIYGKILNINCYSMPEYSTTYTYDDPLFVHSVEPLQYGCVHISSPSVIPNEPNIIVIFNESMEIVEVKEMDTEFNAEYHFAIGDSKQMTGMSDGSIMDFSSIHSTKDSGGINTYLQVTRYDKDFNAIGYARVTGWDFGEETSCLVEYLPVECKDGVYVIWRQDDKKEYTYTYNVSKLDNELNLRWERSIITDKVLNVIGNAFVSENENLVISGCKSAYSDYEIEDHITMCLVIDKDGVMNETVSTSEYCAAVRPYSFYPNPANDKIHMRISPDMSCEKVEIFGLDGKLHHEQNFNLETVNTEGLSTGIYMMKVRFSDGTYYTEKLIKK